MVNGGSGGGGRKDLAHFQLKLNFMPIGQVKNEPIGGASNLDSSILFMCSSDCLFKVTI